MACCRMRPKILLMRVAAATMPAMFMRERVLGFVTDG